MQWQCPQCGRTREASDALDDPAAAGPVCGGPALGLAPWTAGAVDAFFADWAAGLPSPSGDRPAPDPARALACNRRGAAYASQGQYDRAIADFNRAIELNPRSIHAYSHRTLAHAARDGPGP